MTPEREKEIREECEFNARIGGLSYRDKVELLAEIDRLRGLLQAANQTIHELGQTIEEEWGDIPDAVRDWKRVMPNITN